MSSFYKQLGFLILLPPKMFRIHQNGVLHANKINIVPPIMRLRNKIMFTSLQHIHFDPRTKGDRTKVLKLSAVFFRKLRNKHRPVIHGKGGACAYQAYLLRFTHWIENFKRRIQYRKILIAKCRMFFIINGKYLRSTRSGQNISLYNKGLWKQGKSETLPKMSFEINNKYQ